MISSKLAFILMGLGFIGSMVDVLWHHIYLGGLGVLLQLDGLSPTKLTLV
jgi:hypothetical protein